MRILVENSFVSKVRSLKLRTLAAIVVVMGLAAAVPVTLYQTQQRQDLQQSAAEISAATTTISGTLEEVVYDDFANKTAGYKYYIRTSGRERIEVTNVLSVNQFIKSGMQVQVTGKRTDNVIQSSDGIIKPSNTQAANDFQLPPVTGDQKVLIMLVNFPNNPQPPLITRTKMDDVFFNKVNAFYKTISRNKISISGQTLDWFNIPNQPDCDLYSVQLNALNQAYTKIDIKQFSHYIFILPRTSNCQRFGNNNYFATMGKTPFDTSAGLVYGTYAVFNTDTSSLSDTPGPAIMAHEFGHQLGLNHANFLSCTNTSFSYSGCVSEEYGDYADVMGSGSGNNAESLPLPLNIPHMEELGFLGSELQTVTQSGTYSINPLSTTAPGIRGLKIKRSGVNGTFYNGLNYDDYLYIEYRQPIGYDQQILPLTAKSADIFQGVIIHSRLFPWNAVTEWITPGAPYGSPKTLGQGKTFVDPASGATITVTSLTPQGATMSVTVNKTDFKPPSVSIIAPPNIYKGTIQLSADAQDELGIQKVEYFVDTHTNESKTPFASSTTAPYTVTLDTTKYPNGSNYLIRAIAFDKSGNSPTILGNVAITRIGMTIENDNYQPPTLPPLGALFCGNYGDINGDKKIDQSDATKLNEYVGNPNSLDEYFIKAGDVNNDKTTNSIDVVTIARAAQQLITTFDVCSKTKPFSCGALGEIDGDGLITNLDATQVGRYVAGSIQLTPEQLQNADADKNGKIDIVDALFIARYAEGLDSKLKGCSNIISQPPSPIPPTKSPTPTTFVPTAASRR